MKKMNRASGSLSESNNGSSIYIVSVQNKSEKEVLNKDLKK
jgi:hypothetical protein